jgi:hypothetical protein
LGACQYRKPRRLVACLAPFVKADEIRANTEEGKNKRKRKAKGDPRKYDRDLREKKGKLEGKRNTHHMQQYLMAKHFDGRSVRL